MQSNQIGSFQLKSCSLQMNKIQFSTERLWVPLIFVLISTCLISTLVLPVLLVNAHSLSVESSLNDNYSNIQDPDLNGNKQQQSQHGPHMSTKLLQTNHHGNQNRCQSGWMWFNNKCWVTTQSRRDFVHAIELCKKQYNSTLPTIHSEDENEFLRQNIELHNSPIWLFAKHNHQYNRTKWLDKSPVNYTRWDNGQPSDKSSLVCIKTEESWYMKKSNPVDGQTECVSFWEDAKWGTQVGCLVLLPVVCEKKLTPISRYTDGPNGTITSQYEQQQMNGNVAGASSHRCTTLTPILYLIAVISSTVLLNQFTISELKLSQSFRDPI